MHESDHWYASRAVGANDAAKSTLQIGNIEGDGDRKAEIYGGILPSDQKPIWFLQAPKLMKHYAAAAWAKEQGGALPTEKEGEYLDTARVIQPYLESLT